MRLATSLLALVLAAAPAPATGPDQVRELRGDLDAAHRAWQSGQRERAAELYRASVDRARQLPRPGLLLARALDGMGDVRRDQARWQEAAVLFTEAVSLWERLLGPEQPRLAISLYHLALCETALGQTVSARAHAERAWSIWRSHAGAAAPETQMARALLRRLDR